MQMTYEQAMRPGVLMLFARNGSGYMMRSEKREGGYGSPNRRRPPRRRKAGFFYIFFTLLLSVILWPIGMVMLWQRKVRMTSGTKLLISLLTLCMSVFLIVFALTVPLDNVEFTAFQDKANDWLDKAAADVATAGDAAMKKTSETWQAMSDFAEAGKDYTQAYAADAIDACVKAAGDTRAAIEGLFNRGNNTPAPTEAPALTEAPSESEAPADTGTPEATEAPATPVPSATDDAATDAPAETAADTAPTAEATDAATEAPVADATPVNTGDAVVLQLPETSPSADDAQPLGEGTLHANGDFEPGTVDVATDAPAEANSGASLEEATAVPLVPAATLPDEGVTPPPTEEPTQKPEMVLTPVTEEPAATEEAVEWTPVEDATEAPTAEPTAEPTDEPTAEPTDEPTAEPTAEPTEAPAVISGEGYVVKPAGQATVYFFNKSVGFHSGPNRHDMNNAPAHTLQEAFDTDKHPCKSCGMPDRSILDVEHIAWVDADNRIHTSDECPVFKGQWRLMSLEKALDAGYAPCDVCGADFYAEEIFPAPTATPEPTPTPAPEVVSPASALKPAGEAVVYYYDSSVGYHIAPNCASMKNAPAHTLQEAVDAGKNACKHCNPPAASLLGQPALWMDENGVAHTTDACAAFSGKYSLVLRDDALALGLPACPDCGAAEYLIPGTVLAE